MGWIVSPAPTKFICLSFSPSSSECDCTWVEWGHCGSPNPVWPVSSLKEIRKQTSTEGRSLEAAGRPPSTNAIKHTHGDLKFLWIPVTFTLCKTFVILSSVSLSYEDSSFWSSIFYSFLCSPYLLLSTTWITTANFLGNISQEGNGLFKISFL